MFYKDICHIEMLVLAVHVSLSCPCLANWNFNLSLLGRGQLRGKRAVSMNVDLRRKQNGEVCELG